MTDMPEQGHVSIRVQWREKKYILTECGYYKVCYKRQRMYVHRVVYASVHGTLGDNKEINHKDGNPKNNHIDNLELVTTSENLQHSYDELGRSANRGAAKLSDETIFRIKTRRKDGASLKTLMFEFDVPKCTMSYILSGRTYAHVKVE